VALRLEHAGVLEGPDVEDPPLSLLLQSSANAEKETSDTPKKKSERTACLIDERVRICL